MNNPFVIQVNDTHSYELQPDALGELDFVKLDPTHWQVLDDGIAYQVELKAFDYPNRKMELAINGECFQVHIDDKYAQLIDRMGLTKDIVVEISDIQAPMPGLVLKVNYNVGDSFEKGEPLLILEAMKMENVIKAPCDGTVTKVLVKDGQSVEKGQVLLEL